MAQCQLMILFDDKRPRSNGEPITGTVVVKAEKSLSCKGLVVTTGWSTHGRGNVEMGDIAEATLFTGDWQAGQEYRYPFSLATGAWPPSYYGGYLNVGQYVTARAKLSWATDPRATVEYPVVATSAPEDLKPTTAPMKEFGFVGKLIGGVLGIVLLVLLAIPLGMLMLIVVPLLAIGGGLYWFLRVFLPRQITGSVECKLAAERVPAGQSVKATLSFTPRRTSMINGVEWKIRCVEECVSGSGSNRKTHTNERVAHVERTPDKIQLTAGQPQAFDFGFRLPTTAAPSLKFSHNEVKWTVTGRIDIPGWPDYVKEMPLVVVPRPDADLERLPPGFSDSGDAGWDEEIDEEEDDEASPSTLAKESMPPVVAPASPGSNSPDALSADDQWFAQVLEQMRKAPEGGEQLQLVVAAVRDYVFPMEVRLESRSAPPDVAEEFDWSHLDDAEWWRGYVPKQGCSVALAWSDPDVQFSPGQTWRGSAVIIGYDTTHDRVVMEAV